MCRPHVQRVTPALARGTEVIGRHAGNGARPALGIQLEELRVRPHIGALGGDENRRITHELNATAASMIANGLQLPEETPLDETLNPLWVRITSSRTLQRRRLAARELARPLLPALSRRCGLKRLEQCVVIEPLGLTRTEFLVLRARRCVGLIEETLGGTLQTLQTPGHDNRVVHPLCAESVSGLKFFLTQPTVLLQFLQIDQQRVARKGRVAHVGRVAGTDAAQGQDLPQTLLAHGEPIDEMPRRRAEITRAMRPGQAGRVQQYPARTRQSHESSPCTSISRLSAATDIRNG